MPKDYDEIDLDFTHDGDFLLDKTGDIKDTKEDMLLSLKNEIYSIIKSEVDDWKEHPDLGTGLNDFIGEANTRNLGSVIENRVRNSLNIIIEDNDLQVQVVPVGVHKVLITLQVTVIPTLDNGLKFGDSVIVNFLYDYFERGVFVPIEDMKKFGGRSF